jgi:hypothetical protein
MRTLFRIIAVKIVSIKASKSSLVLAPVLRCAVVSVFLGYAFVGFAFAQNTIVEPTPSLRLGVFGHYTRSQHVADFTEIQGVPTCCDERYGTIWTTAPLFTVGALAELPITSWLSAAVRANYTTMNATLQATSQAVAEGGAMVSNIHSLSARLSSAGLEAMVAVRPVRQMSIYAGFRAGFLTQSRYDYKETLASKGFVYKDDSTATRNIRPDQALPNPIIFQPSLLAGASYEFPMNREGTLLLTPEVFYSFGLSNIVSSFVGGGSWRVHQLRGGLSVRWSPTRTTPLGVEELQEQYRDTLLIAERRAKLSDSLAAEAKKRQFSARITGVAGVEPDGRRTESPTIRLTTRPLVVSTALISSIFFAEQSAVLPSRYKRILASERGDFSIARVAAQSPLEQYFHLLNIIGKRCTDRTTTTTPASLTLIGSARATEKNANELARRRAEAVREYLHNIWSIPTSEIRIETRIVSHTPQAASGQALSGQALSGREDEAYCVELRSAAAETLAPLVHNASTTNAEPPVIEYGLEMAAGAGLKQWDFELTQIAGKEATTVMSRTGSVAVPSVRWAVDSMVSHALPVPVLVAGNVEAKLNVSDAQNNVVDAPIVSLPVTSQARTEAVQRFVVLSADDDRSLSAIRTLLPAAAFFTIRSSDSTAAQMLLNKLTAGNSSIQGHIELMESTQLASAAAKTSIPEERLYGRALTVEVLMKTR